MGHEMGHYVLHHVYKFLAFMIIIAVAFFALLRWAPRLVAGRWGARWGIRDVGDPAVLPLAMLILSILLFFVLTPIINTPDRAWTSTRPTSSDSTPPASPTARPRRTLLLGEYRKLDPTPLEEFLFYDHPSGRTRIYAAMRWKAENQCLGTAVNPCPR